MNVSLTRELETYIQAKVDSGMYQTASEVVREALRGLREREHHLAWERREVRKGLDAARRGEVVDLTPALLEGIKTRGRRRLTGQPRKKLA